MEHLILSAGPTSCRNLHCAAPFARRTPGDRRSGLKSCKPRFFQCSSLLCNWLHCPQDAGIHVENKASHRNILCARYLMSGQARFNASGQNRGAGCLYRHSHGRGDHALTCCDGFEVVEFHSDGNSHSNSQSPTQETLSREGRGETRRTLRSELP